MVSTAQKESGPTSNPELSIHPVAAIMPGIMNPVAYHAVNETTVLDGSDDSDGDVSAPQSDLVGIVIESSEAAVNILPEPLKKALLTIPHLFWRASVSPDILPVLVDCLLDNGSHMVLICDSLVNQLRLCKRRLRTPIKTDLAMHLNENKMSVTLYDFVKLPYMMYLANTMPRLSVPLSQLTFVALFYLDYHSYPIITLLLIMANEQPLTNPITMIF